MKPTAVACNYALLRFRPYADGGEFANVGIVLWSEQAGFFDYCCDARCKERVTAFFPHLDATIFERALTEMAAEIERVGRRITVAANNSPAPVDHKPMAEQSLENLRIPRPRQIYQELIRMREGMLTFGPDATAMTEDPKALMTQLIAGHLIHKMSLRRGDAGVVRAA